MAVHDLDPLDLGPAPERSQEGGETLQLFGNYRLFKQLRRDDLGEVYRAGQLGVTAVERVVSLRLFNGAEVDRERLWEGCQSRRELKTALSGGPFGDVVDIGFEAGIPYVAHEYVFGRTLAEMLAQAREKSYPVPFEHALLLMDRISNALRNAYQTRLEGERVTHGFLIPEFVHISNEGEIRLSGFETSQPLLDSAGPAARRAAVGYIAPEVNQNLAPKACDDIYSMGSILCELLTGEPLPELNPSESSRWVEAAVLEAEGTPLPEGVRHLIRESLLPRDHRIQTAEKWHKLLTDITATSGINPTTFNLAFFMHTLFGDELDREAELVEAEKRSGLPEASPAAAPAPEPEPEPTPAAIDPPAVEPPPVATSAPPEEEASAPESKPFYDLSSEPAPLEEPTTERLEALEEPIEESTSGDRLGSIDLDAEEDAAPEVSHVPQARSQAAAGADAPRRWIGIAAVILVVVGGLVAFFVVDLGPKAQPIEVSAAARPDAGPGQDGVRLEPVNGIDSLAPPLSPEELENQVKKLVAQRAGDMEASLKAEYDKRLVELRAQLESARKAEAEKLAEPEPEPEVDEEPLTAEVAREPQETVVTPPKRTSAARPQVETPLLIRTNRNPPSEPVAAQPEPQAATPPRIETPTTTPPVQAKPEPPEPEPAPAKPDPVKTEAPVKPGSVVAAGPGVVGPKLTREPRVIYPPAAARLKREATVKVRILVDENGKPSEIEQIGKKIGLGFDQAALHAAKTTRWTPPEKDGVPVKMWVELSIDFRP